MLLLIIVMSSTLFIPPSLHSKSVDDRRLRIDISSLKEFILNEEMSSVPWCPGSIQLANGMTKQGAKVDSLLNILQSGVLDLSGWE